MNPWNNLIMNIRFLLGIAALGFIQQAAPAADWLQFRGPGGTAVSPETGLPIKLDATKNIAWKANLPGRGLSSPVVVGDRVFVTSASGPQQERLHVFCFSARDGKKLWERQYWATGRTMTQDKTCVAAPTAVSDGRLLYAIFSSNDLLCLDLEGNLIWLRGLTRDYPNASNSLGLASSLLLIGKVLIVQVDNDSESFSAALDAKTGVNIWKISRFKTANWCSPVAYPDSSSGNSAVLLQNNKGLQAVDALTGKILWSYDQGASTIPSATVDDGIVYVPSKGITALKPGATGQPPEQVWRGGQLQPGTCSPVVQEGRIYTVNSAGILTCGDTKTGTRIWQLRLKGPFSSTPVASGKHLYMVNEKGLMQVVDVNPTLPEGQVAGELDLGATILCTPAIASQALYIRSDSALWKIAHPPGVQ
jgi:outer membrane protein assembly factor BamB